MIAEAISFKVELDIGNEAMSSPEDVADALERIAGEIRSGDDSAYRRLARSGELRGRSIRPRAI